MAPEVGLDEGYHLPADVYSFGVLLWEICALKKPFGAVRSAEEFQEKVFEQGARPKIGRGWSPGLVQLIEDCWAKDPARRPRIAIAKSLAAALVRDMTRKQAGGKEGLRKSMLRRISIG